MEKEYYSIGEIAKLCNIPIRTLHYYDEIGLLKPDKKDEVTNYRYYAKNQILHLNIINQFKIQGYTLKEIKERLLSNDITLNTKALQLKRTEIHNNIEALINLEKRLDYYLNVLEYQDGLPHIHLKKLPKMKIAYLREKGLADATGFMKRFAQLQSLLSKQRLVAKGSIMALYYDDYHEYNSLNADIEVCVPIDDNIETNEYVREIGECNVVSALHYGAYCNETKTYILMMAWMKENNLVMKGSPIENYLIDPILTPNEDEYVTELMIPV